VGSYSCSLWKTSGKFVQNLWETDAKATSLEKVLIGISISMNTT
jgi:hypothetical protein